MRRSLIWGALAAAVYIGTTVVSMRTGLVPGGVLYDGLAPPQPYRWVKAPRDAQTRERAQAGMGTVELGPEQSLGNSISTDDGQATVIFRLGSIPLKPGQTFVDITIEPIDPAPLPPLSGRNRIQGNAYRVDGRYRESGEPAPVDKAIAVVLRYPTHATKLVRLDGRRWRELKPTPSTASLQLFGDSNAFGTFAAAAVPTAEELPIPWWGFVGAGAGLTMVVGLILIQRSRRAPVTRAARRRRSRGRGRRSGRRSRSRRGRR